MKIINGRTYLFEMSQIEVIAMIVNENREMGRSVHFLHVFIGYWIHAQEACRA